MLRDSGLAPLRVLMLATRVPATQGDGTPSFILDAALALPEDVTVEILAPRVRGAARDQVTGRVAVRRFAYFPRRWERLADDAIMPQLGRSPILWFQAMCLVIALAINALRAHRRMRPDVVHAQWIIPAGFIALLLKRAYRTPFLVTSRGADAFVLRRWPVERLRQRVARDADLVIAVSEEIAGRFRSVAPGVVTQPSGIDFAAWRTMTSPRSAEPNRLLIVARLDPKKGVDVALRALAAVEDAALRIVGDGPLRDELEGLTTELGVNERVTFLGRLSRDDVASEHRAATCLLVPSVVAADGDRDGTPNVIGEAIASGLPIIASATAGICGLLRSGQNALLHRPGDHVGLSELIRELLSDRALQVELARAAHTDLKDLLDARSVAERHTLWYRALADA